MGMCAYILYGTVNLCLIFYLSFVAGFSHHVSDQVIHVYLSYAPMIDMFVVPCFWNCLVR